MVTYGNCEQLERASHIAHSVACHLRLLATAACAQRGPSFQLCAHSFAAGMHGLSDAVRELQDQLDELPISSHHEANRELAQCSRIATRVAGLMQLTADAIGESRVNELELDVEDFLASVQYQADRLREIEGALNLVQRRLAATG